RVPSGIHGTVRAPASKSYTNRALVMAALADGVSHVLDPLESDDTQRMEQCLRGLGVEITRDKGGWRVAGKAGRPDSPSSSLNAGISGTTMRFIEAVLTLTRDGGTVTGEPGLLRRPVHALSEALRVLGAEVTDREGFPPAHAGGGGLLGGDVTVDAKE